MSILIKNMPMPKNCGECKLAAIIPIGDYDTYSICPPLHRHIDKYTDTRRTDCPLIELPPHGDLIDRRKLPLAFVDVTDLPVDRCLPVYLQEDVDSAPIVVGSEE